MLDKIEKETDNFTITRSGLFHKLLLKIGMADSSQKGFLKRSLLLAGITWLPLLFLSALQGLAFGNKVEITFLEDFAAFARFLIVVPILVFSEKRVDVLLKELTIQFFKSGILDESQFASYTEIKKKVLQLCESMTANVIILLIIATNLVLRLLAAKSYHLSVWYFLPETHGASLSWAGFFYGFVSVPVLQFLIAQWLWRWMVWVIYFKKLSKLPLKLNPAHPDLAGGIGFLGFPPGPFMQVGFAIAILFSAAIAEQILFLHVKLQDFYWVMGGFAFFSIILNVLPLLVFMKTLVAHRRRGFFEYSALIQEHHRQFDDKWVGKPIEEKIRGFTDASSLADMNSSFNTVKNMKSIPFDLKIMMSSIIIAIVPFIPLFAFEYNLFDILLKVVRMFL